MHLIEAHYQYYDAICGTFHVACAIVLSVVICICLRPPCELTEAQGHDVMVVGLTCGTLLLVPLAFMLGYDVTQWERNPNDEQSLFDPINLTVGALVVWAFSLAVVTSVCGAFDRLPLPSTQACTPCTL